MSRKLSTALLAAAVALSPISLIATSAPAAAQVNVSFNVGFDYFYDELSPYGDWNYHPRWGDVWRPRRIGADFRPYYRGYWVNTVEYGWTWETEDPWGDIPYHYGRWVYDPYDGWLWVPGYTWAPAWVVWRQGGGNVGWFPMPPDDRFLAGYDVYRDDWNWDRGYFGYSDWYGPSVVAGLTAAWTFVALDRFADRDYYRYARPRTQVVNIINNTTNITNYVTVNNRIVNRSVDITQVERASGRRIQRVEARNVVRTPIETIDRGQQIATRERERHGGDARAPARERVQQLTREEARTPVRERRNVRFQRDQQQAQPGQAQPGQAQQPDAQDRRDQQRAQRDQQQNNAAQQRGQAEQREREQRNAVQQREQQERAREDRAATQQRENAERQDRARAEQAERQQRDQAERQQRAQSEQQERAAAQRAEQQNRARAEQAEKQQQREQVERQRRSEVQQQEQRAQAEQQNRARAEQQQQRAQAEQQNRARADQQQRAQAQQEQRAQQQAAAQERQQRQKAQRNQKSDEEEKQQERRGR